MRRAASKHLLCLLGAPTTPYAAAAAPLLRGQHAKKPRSDVAHFSCCCVKWLLLLLLHCI
jgi:hypothetical protein